MLLWRYMNCYYYVEKKPDVSYEESKIRCICIECKDKLFPKDKMMSHYGEFGNFDVKCSVCGIYINKENKYDNTNN